MVAVPVAKLLYDPLCKTVRFSFYFFFAVAFDAIAPKYHVSAAAKVIRFKSKLICGKLKEIIIFFELAQYLATAKKIVKNKQPGLSTYLANWF